MLILNQLLLIGVAMLVVSYIRKDHAFSLLKNWLMTILVAEVFAFIVGMVGPTYPGYILMSGAAYAAYMFGGVFLYSFILNAIQFKVVGKKTL